jgi:hypothetical protein
VLVEALQKVELTMGVLLGVNAVFEVFYHAWTIP